MITFKMDLLDIKVILGTLNSINQSSFLFKRNQISKRHFIQVQNFYQRL